MDNSRIAGQKRAPDAVAKLDAYRKNVEKLIAQSKQALGDLQVERDQHEKSSLIAIDKEQAECERKVKELMTQIDELQRQAGKKMNELKQHCDAWLAAQDDRIEAQRRILAAEVAMMESLTGFTPGSGAASTSTASRY